VERFEICCHANDRNDKTKAKKLPTLLQGEVIVVWFDRRTRDIQYSKVKIVEQMAPAHFVTLIGFHKRSLHTDKDDHELKQLLEQALLTADNNTSK